VVVSGIAKVTNGEAELFVRTNESTFIPAGHKHRLENPGLVDLVMIEVQSGNIWARTTSCVSRMPYGRYTGEVG
jgi:mannose-1-phosphate guanylyltransferase